MNFVKVLDETIVLVCFEKLDSRFNDIAKSTMTLQNILLSWKEEKGIFNFSGLFKTCSNLHSFNLFSVERVSL